MLTVCTHCAFTRRKVLGFDILRCVKNRALPPLIIICGRLQRPVSDIFILPDIFRWVKQTASRAVFLLAKI
jgi:hypothetical protein